MSALAKANNPDIQIAIYNTLLETESALQRLRSWGFDRHQVSLVMPKGCLKDVLKISSEQSSSPGSQALQANGAVLNWLPGRMSVAIAGVGYLYLGGVLSEKLASQSEESYSLEQALMCYGIGPIVIFNLENSLRAGHIVLATMADDTEASVAARKIMKECGSSRIYSPDSSAHTPLGKHVSAKRGSRSIQKNSQQRSKFLYESQNH